MSRFARLVVPGLGHHVTQRGNHRRDIFFSDRDRSVYLDILQEQAQRRGVRIVAWCLMTNHVHFIVVPAEENALALVFGRTHQDYARWIHAREQTTGHLWQNRFYSCVLDGRHLWTAARYVELNPVRAGLVAKPDEWRWSSARAHLGGTDDRSLIDCTDWAEVWSPATWAEALAPIPGEQDYGASVRAATLTGRPCGDSTWLEQLEVTTGRSLRRRKPGPKPRKAVMSCGIT